MESLHLTNSTFYLKYFRNKGIVQTKAQVKEIKLEK